MLVQTTALTKATRAELPLQEGQAALEEAAVLTQAAAATLRGLYALEQPSSTQQELEALLTQ